MTPIFDSLHASTPFHDPWFWSLPSPIEVVRAATPVWDAVVSGVGRVFSRHALTAA